MTEPGPHACVVCQQRIPNRQPVCDADRAALDSMLSEIPDLFAVLPTAIEPGSATGPKVSGSREAPVPLRLDVVDLTLPARGGVVRDDLGDQFGHLSVPTILDQWVRDWRDTLWPDHHLPVPTVVTLAGWLRVRLDTACDKHPAIDEFAAEMRSLRRTLKAALGLHRHIDRLPAPCPTCELTTLIRYDGASYVECTSCGRLWTEEDYRRLCVVLAAEQEVA